MTVYAITDTKKMENRDCAYLSLNYPTADTLLNLLRDTCSFRQGCLLQSPYKRWSKCTMEKVGGSVFAET